MIVSEADFWEWVDRTDSCWLWLGKLSVYGYGTMTVSGKTMAAHRYSWLLDGKKLIKGQTLDHLCRVRNCVNPAHLEQVTIKENVLRGEGITALEAKQTHCNKGHEFNEQNTYKYRGARYCKACNRFPYRKSRAKVAVGSESATPHDAKESK